MQPINQETIALTEYQPVRLPAERLSTRQAEFLWQRHRHQVHVDPPSFKTQGEWQLTAQGWIGLLAVDRHLTIELQPKVPISNLFEIVAYAYGLDELPFANALVKIKSVTGFLDRLANHFVGLVRRQREKGLYHAYAAATGALPYVRGQLDLNSLWASPPGRDVICHFDELTTDVLENRIIVWTLHQLIQSGFCTTQTEGSCRRLLTDLRDEISLERCTPDDCDRVSFHQLNREYRPLIALARFLLSGYEPSHNSGQKLAPPFIINSATLFERFVAGWLGKALDDRYRLFVQERRSIGLHERLHFAIDLTIYQRSSGEALFVMDTKYKRPSSTPETADIAQVVAYAEAVGAPEAVLIYPTSLTHPLDEQIGRIRVRSLVFDLAEGVARAGGNFLDELLSDAMIVHERT